jgi:hypothetical protein
VGVYSLYLRFKIWLSCYEPEGYTTKVGLLDILKLRKGKVSDFSPNVKKIILFNFYDFLMLNNLGFTKDL